MNNTIFQFPIGTEVEFILSRNKIFENAVLKGTVDHYFRKPGRQTVLNLVHIKAKSGEFRVDVDCIVTKPTQDMINEVNKLAEEAIKAKEQVVKKDNHRPKREHKRDTPFKLGDSANIIKTKAITWLYIASKSSKIFHDVDFEANTIKFVFAYDDALDRH